MKAKFHYLPVLLCLIFSSSLLRSQSIDELQIIPSNPTSTDEVKIVCNVYFQSDKCERINFDILQSDKNIEVISYHKIVGKSKLCFASDTINMGIFETGSYSLIYYSSDITNNKSDIDTIFFDVSDDMVTGIEGSRNSFDVEIYPNPATNFIYIDYDFELGDHDIEFKVYNVIGDEIKIINSISEIGRIRLDTSKFVQDIYIYIYI